MDRPQTGGLGAGDLAPEYPAPGDLAPDYPDYLAEQVRAWEAAEGLAGGAGGAGAGGGAVVATGTALERELAAELEAVRTRLAYYERFDSLINDSVQRAADLFQALFAEREQQRRAGADLAAEIEAAAAAEAERRLAEERRGAQETLMALMTEAGRLQRQVDGLIQQIAEAVTDLSGRGPSSYDTPYAPYDGPGA